METVTVACKIPNGMILHHQPEGGAKLTIKLNGNRNPIHPKTGRELRKFEVAGEAASGIGGYGLTPNVPKDLWDKIYAESKDTPPFANGLIFALGDTASARDCAKELSPDMHSGLDPIDPEKPLADKVEKINPSDE